MLTFAGEPLLFPGHLGMNPPDAPDLPLEQWRELDKWLQYHHSLDDLGQFGAMEARVASGRQACRSRFEQNKGLGLPVMNWPAPPPPRLNTLYWPTGATRWARGWFLTTRAGMLRIRSSVRGDGGFTTGTLGIGDDADNDTDTPAMAITMHMLPPQPLSCSLEPGGLWLIPLVDERYFWQFASFGDNTVTTSTTWANLFTTLGTQLGVTVNVASSVEAAYLKPDPTDFSRRYDNAALLLDAAAWSCGRRIHRRIDGGVYCQSRSLADTILSANLKKKWRQIAGGDFSFLGGGQPAALICTFRKIKQYLLQENGKLYTKETAAATVSDKVTVSGRKLVIHCAAYADYDTSDVLQNGTALNALAAQIATDYYGWASEDYDYSFAGILDWTPCGYDDAILWRFGSLCGGEQQAQTRVSTLPGNFFADVHLASDPDKEIVEPRLMAVADGDIAAGAEGTVSLYDSYTNDTTKNVIARNIGSMQWTGGNKGWVEGIGNAVWLGTPAECP